MKILCSRWVTPAACAAIFLASWGCDGPKGPQGAPGTGTGGLEVHVTDAAAGTPVSGATVITSPATSTQPTDTQGKAVFSAIPIGSYTVTVTAQGYESGQYPGAGVAAGLITNVSIALNKPATLTPTQPLPTSTPTPTLTPTGTPTAPPTASLTPTPTLTVPPTVGSLSGTIRNSKGPVVGAQVCVVGSTICTTSGSGGTYTLSGVASGFVFVAASATGLLPGETRQAASLTAGASLQGVDVTLSGRPTDAATYVGSNVCVTCHKSLNASLVAAWQGSAHVGAVDRTTAHVDVTGWPAAPADCTAPATLDAGFTASDPNPTILQDREVYLVRWKGGCTGQPEFAMAFDTNQNGAIDTGDTIIPVNGSMGGVATGAGQCGNGGIIPANAPCAANLGGSGSTAAKGWWQQEYLVDIGTASKPSWVTWNTTNTPSDALILPAAWNQRSKQWVAAPDYNPTQGGTYSKACAGCHNAGLSLSADSSGNVTSYSSVDPYIGCEKCHGPGSAHVSAGGDPQLIVNPTYLTAQSEREVCGQCHSQGVSSTSPAGVFGFAWNSVAAVGGGNFIPGVHLLSDFQSAPAYGDPDFYWPSGFPSTDHITYVDFEATVHVNNPYEKLTCADCHSGHGGTGGPLQFQRTNGQTGDRYVFQNNDATLRDDVLCLSCHATHGSFASLTLEDAARYHVSAGGTVQKNGTSWAVSADDQATSAAAVAATVRSHMITQAAMPAYYDPTGTIGTPAGRCSSCHMAKTAFTASFYSGLDASGKTANVIGDVTSHTFRVAWPDMSLVTVAGATSWDGVMPNACGACHPEYRFGK